MTRTIKAALALLSIGLLLGLGAASASAVPTFAAGKYPALITGSASEVVIGTEGSVVRCPIDYQAQIGGPTSSVSFTTIIHYYSCISWGFAGTSVHNPASCQQIFHAAEKEAADQYGGDFEVDCSVTSGIGITAGQCAIEIPSQEVSGVDLDNSTGAPNRVTADFEVSGLKYNVTKDNFGCPLGGLGSKTGGTITGEPFQLKAVNPSKPSEEVGLSVTGE